MKALDPKAQSEFRDAFVKVHERHLSDVDIAMLRNNIIATGVLR